jgi:hypothetical protein
MGMDRPQSREGRRDRKDSLRELRVSAVNGKRLASDFGSIRSSGGGYLLSRDEQDRTQSPRRLQACGTAGKMPALREGRGRPHAPVRLLRAEEEDGDADAVLDAAGGGSEEDIGKQTVAMCAHGNKVTSPCLNPADDFSHRIAKS